MEVRLDAFRAFQLRLQDGPDLCFACLKRGLAEETSDAPVVAHLSLGEEDVRDYLEAHRPVKTWEEEFNWFFSVSTTDGPRDGG